MTNLQSRAWAFIIGQRHYDTGNKLFSIMLDKGMNYSCGFWTSAAAGAGLQAMPPGTTGFASPASRFPKNR
jgi:cyclopropane fatty-acyl-phospholipid synthase-like methyltransferase